MEAHFQVLWGVMEALAILGLVAYFIIGCGFAVQAWKSQVTRPQWSDYVLFVISLTMWIGVILYFKGARLAQRMDNEYSG